MNDDTIENYVDAAADMLEIELSAEGRPVVVSHLRIAAQMSRLLIEFPLPDDAEPAPVFNP